MVHSKSKIFTQLSLKFVSVVGTTVLIGGVILAVINMLILVRNEVFYKKLGLLHIEGREERVEFQFAKIRSQLGDITALGLEILVVSDVMESLTQPTEEFTYLNLGKLCAISGFRTILAWSLSREVKEVKEDSEKMRWEEEEKRRREVKDEEERRRHSSLSLVR